MRGDGEQDHQLRTCQVCGVHDRLYTVRNRQLCEGCCRDEIRTFNELVREAEKEIDRQC